MSEPQAADPAARLAAITALPEAEGLDELASILAGTNLSLSDVRRVLAATVRSCHAAAVQGGRVIVAAILDVPPKTDRDARIAQAVADIICPLPQRH